MKKTGRVSNVKRKTEPSAAAKDLVAMDDYSQEEIKKISAYRPNLLYPSAARSEASMQAAMQVADPMAPSYETRMQYTSSQRDPHNTAPGSKSIFGPGGHSSGGNATHA